MEQQEKNLQTIAQQKVTIAGSPGETSINQAGSLSAFEEKNTKVTNHILNVIKELKDQQSKQTIWFDFLLPSNGKCGYPKEIKIREMTTEDEKILIKEMFSSKENSILNVVRKCVKFENLPNFDFETLTTFDQDYIIVQLSSITFPGEKDIIVTDDANHKISMKLNKEDLELVIIPDTFEYPAKVDLLNSGLTWYLNFITSKKTKEIEKATKSLSADVLNRLFISVSINTEKIEKNGQPITIENFYEVVRLMDTLSPADLKKLVDFYNDKMGTVYGYKLDKEYYCTECGKGGVMSLEPLNFFRVTI